jgi:hypothetical protein
MMEQLDRARRYLHKIERQYAGLFSSSGHDEQEYFDDVISFFIHCYHVRDWALHEDDSYVSARVVDSFIDSHQALKICADLANGLKHCKLTRSMRTGHQPSVTDRQTQASTWLTGNGGGEVLQCSYRVTSSGQSHDVLSLARECITLWESFRQTSSCGTAEDS